MKFEFDSINELQDFLEFAGYEKRTRDLPALEMSPLSSDDRARLLDAFGVPPQTSGERAQAPHETYDATMPAIAGHCAVDASGNPTALVIPVQEQDAPARRKRRTKPEIEADKAAAEAAAGTPVIETPTDAQAIAATSPLAGANPFDASTSNEPAATAALNGAQPGTTGTLTALAADALADELAATAEALTAVPADPNDYIALRVAEMGGTFDPREHMKKCVEFIGALGKAKYDEAFTLAGTSRAVASYTPADCAKHIAALEYLQIAG